MNNFYFAFVKIGSEGADNIGCVVNLDALPPGANSDMVEEPLQHGVDLAHWAASDPARTARIFLNISQRNFDDEALSFITQCASFWENLPPADEAKSALLVIQQNADGTGAPYFVRTDEKTASETWANALHIGKPK